MRLARSIIGAALLAVVPTVVRAQQPPDLSQLADFVVWSGVVSSFFVVVTMIVLLRVTGGISRSLGERFPERRLFIQKLDSFVRFLFYVVTTVVALSLSFRIDPTTIKVIGGALAFAVGFAMRDLVAAFIAGVTIMFDRPFQVGDRVSYSGEYGDIVKIGLRSVRMNTLDHNLVTIPNNKVLTDVTASGNYGALEMQVAMDFYVGLDQDVELASSIIQEACLTSRFCFLDREAPIFLKQEIVSDYMAFHLKARPYVIDVKYEKAFETDVHLRVQREFRKRGIQPPAVLHRSEPDSQPPLDRADLPAVTH